MMHSETAIIDCVSLINENDFHKPLNRDIYGIIRSLYRRGVIPTYVEVIKESMSMGLIKTAQDAEHIKYVASKHIADHNAGYWADRVRTAAKGRKAQQLIHIYADQIEGPRADVNQVISDAGADFMALAMDAETETIESAADVAKYGVQLVGDNCEKWRAMKEEERAFGDIPLEGVSTGIPKLDDLTFGYKSGDLVILGAQTGHGKTAYALNSALACYRDGNHPVLYINTEMSRKQIAYRWAAMLSDIPIARIRTGNLKDDEIAVVTNALAMFSQSNFYTSYIPNLTPEKLQALARKAKLQHGIELLIIDYVGRMDTSSPKQEEWQVLYQIVKSQKQLAQNLDIACMVLVQLNPDGSLQGAKRMKNECDLMLKLLPLCEDLKDEEQRFKAQEKWESKYGAKHKPFNYLLWIDKSRDSESGLSIPIEFIGATQQMTQAEEV
jgi:replicative DNA helicase